MKTKTGLKIIVVLFILTEAVTILGLVAENNYQRALLHANYSDGTDMGIYMAMKEYGFTEEDTLDPMEKTNIQKIQALFNKQ